MSNASRYWRIISDHSSYFTIGEIELRETKEGANVAVGGTAFANSIYQDHQGPEKALDGNPATEFHSGGWGAGANWWAYDFGEGVEREINWMLFTQRTSDATWGPNSWRVQLSDDGVTWRHFGSGKGASFPAGVPVLLRVSPFAPHERVMRMVDFSAHRCKGRQFYAGRQDEPVIDPTKAPWHPRPMLLRSARVEFGGLYQLDGTTTSLGEPLSRRVRLYHQHSGKPVGEMVTNDDGLFSFTHIEEGPWVVIGLDDSGSQNGVIYSHVKAVPMVF